MHELAGCLEGASLVGRIGLQPEELALLLHPAAMDIGQHAHSLDHLGIAQRAVRILLGTDRRPISRQQRWTGAALVEPGQHHLHHGTQHSRPAQHRTDGEQDERKHQRDRRLHRRREYRMRQKIPQGTEIVHRLDRRRAQATQVGLVNRLEHTRRHTPVKQLASFAHGLGARPVQHLHHHENEQHQQREHGQCQMVAAVDHSTVDLEHVEGRRQYQQARQQGKAEGTPEIRLECQQGLGQFWLFLVGIHAIFSSTIRYSGHSSPCGARSATSPTPTGSSQKLSSNSLSARCMSTISRKRHCWNAASSSGHKPS